MLAPPSFGGACFCRLLYLVAIIARRPTNTRSERIIDAGETFCSRYPGEQFAIQRTLEAASTVREQGAHLFHQVAFRNRNGEQITLIYIYRYIPFGTATLQLRLMGHKFSDTAMRSDDYRHLRAAFAEMALQRSHSPEGARWLAVAQTCLELELQQPVRSLRPGRPVLTSLANGGTSEAPAPRRSAGQDRRPYGTAPPRLNLPNNTALSIYRKLGA